MRKNKYRFMVYFLLAIAVSVMKDICPPHLFQNVVLLIALGTACLMYIMS